MLAQNICAGVKGEGQGSQPASAGLAGFPRGVGGYPEPPFGYHIPERGKDN